MYGVKSDDGRQATGVLGHDAFANMEYGLRPARVHGIPALETSIVIVHIPGKGVDRTRTVSLTLHTISASVQRDTIDPDVLAQLADAKLTDSHEAPAVSLPGR